LKENDLRALISVYDKSNIVEFAAELSQLGWEIIATGNTERILKESGLGVIPVEQLTNFTEMLGGRVKTLHPAIHAGILARDTEEDANDLDKAGYAPLNMVVCNLYPFQATVSNPDVTMPEAIEKIDIGGVTLLRAAAKNHALVSAVSDVKDYPQILVELKNNGEISLGLRQKLAVKAFAHTREYDTAIHTFLESRLSPAADSDKLPDEYFLGLHQEQSLRYGENPHQNAAYYSYTPGEGPLGGKLLGGKALSYNNILDVDAAWRTVSTFDEPTVVIVKHLTTTGVATAETLTKAYPGALASDPVSAFGGIIAVNRAVDTEFATILGDLFVEAIVAPDFSDDAVAQLQKERKNCRLLKVPQKYDGKNWEIRGVHRGVLLQNTDMGDPQSATFDVVSDRQPTDEEVAALKFAWNVVQHIKSNCIVVANKDATVGVGGGLPSRVDAAKLSVLKAGDKAKGAVMASDAFFPFPDALEVGIEAGVTAAIEPGGSIRDDLVIEAANKAGIVLVFTGTRHFRH
jgi:phosphoribosylaminoimidazolecarboxamide formyltransferase / IMP cyclohydrolase